MEGYSTAQDPKTQQKTTDLRRNYDRTEDGRPVKFSVELKRYIPEQDVLILVSPTAYYFSEPDYLGPQIQFIYDEIYTKHKGRIIIFNSGDLGRRTVQFKRNKDTLDDEVNAEANRVTKNWRRLFFGGLGSAREANVREMIESGRLVYTELEDWTGIGNVQKDTEPSDELDEKILKLRELSRAKEQNKKLFEDFRGNSDLFEKYHKTTLEEYAKEDSDVRRTMDVWVEVFYQKCYSPSEMGGREKEVRESVLLYCLEEAVVAAVWRKYVPQMVYPFGLSRDLSNPAREAWAAVDKRLRSEEEAGVKFLTLTLPTKKSTQQMEEAERIRQKDEETERLINELRKAKEQAAEAQRKAAEEKEKRVVLAAEIALEADFLQYVRTKPNVPQCVRDKREEEGLRKIVALAGSASASEDSDEDKAMSPKESVVQQQKEELSVVAKKPKKKEMVKQLGVALTSANDEDSKDSMESVRTATTNNNPGRIGMFKPHSSAPVQIPATKNGEGKKKAASGDVIPDDLSPTSAAQVKGILKAQAQEDAKKQGDGVTNLVASY